MNLVGKQAPQFTSAAVVDGVIVENFRLPQNQNTLLIFYPLDFTFVCPTELLAFQERLKEFTERGTQVVGCSVDSVYAHFAWVSTPRAKGGIQGVTYPLVADLTKSIARSFGVLIEEKGIALRGLFLIDRQGVVRHQIVNDLGLGRSVDEALRMVHALCYHEEHGEVCPANWQLGEKAMEPTQEGLCSYVMSKR